MRAWQSTSEDVRTRICMDDMAKAYKKEQSDAGKEVTHRQVEKVVQTVAEHRNKRFK